MTLHLTKCNEPCWWVAGEPEAGARKEGPSGPLPGCNGSPGGARASLTQRCKQAPKLGPLHAGFVHPSGEVRLNRSANTQHGRAYQQKDHACQINTPISQGVCTIS